MKIISKQGNGNKVHIYIDGEYLTSVPLSVNADVTKNDFLAKMESMRTAMLSRTTHLIIAFLLIFLALRYLYFKRRKRRAAKEINLKQYYKKTQG